MIRRFQLDEAVRDARARTGVPGVAAGLSVAGGHEVAADGFCVLDGSDVVTPDTPFRIASISKPFTATLVSRCLELDAEVCALLSHTAGLRPEAAAPLPDACRGLWSYSNAGYWEAGARAAAASGTTFSDAMAERVLEPLGLRSTGYSEPRRPARGHVQEGERGHRAVLEDAYPVERRPSGGLWSTVGDLLRFGEHHLEHGAELRRPQAVALGARYALGWWVRDVGGRTAFDHEGSVGGYQSLLLVVPEDRIVLAVLTNSWRGSGLIRRLVSMLDLAPRAVAPTPVPKAIAGRYELDGVEATVRLRRGGIEVTEAETDPVTGTRVERRYPATSLFDTVFGFAGGVLQSHRFDFPRADVARVGWVALPRSTA